MTSPFQKAVDFLRNYHENVTTAFFQKNHCKSCANVIVVASDSNVFYFHKQDSIKLFYKSMITLTNAWLNRTSGNVNKRIGLLSYLENH